jgi:hypothetical protein
LRSITIVSGFTLRWDTKAQKSLSYHMSLRQVSVVAGKDHEAHVLAGRRDDARLILEHAKAQGLTGASVEALEKSFVV